MAKQSSTTALQEMDVTHSGAGGSPRILPGAEWPSLYDRARAILPEAFGDEGRVRNLISGTWGYPGQPRPFYSPCDGTLLCFYPMIDTETAREAVRFAAREHHEWLKVDLDERRLRVSACTAALRQHRELLAYLLVWEIGKPYAQALVSVDRCISGVEWYVEQIEHMLDNRPPLGLISNIASWNYPLSVLVHAVLVQTLAGNAVMTKSPTDGSLCALTLALGLARRCGLPVSLVSGSGGDLSEILVRDRDVACLAFVGGRSNGRDIAASLYDHDKRYMLEMEGINAYGVWEFSDWGLLAKQIKKGFEYGKQRCTAYPRYVIQRRLFPQFLAMYLPVVGSLSIGHPLLVRDGETEPPKLDFGPLINGRTVEALAALHEEALTMGAVDLFRGELDDSAFFAQQDRSAYVAPAALMNVPHNCELYHKEPFGPIDSLVVVDRVEELIAEMNVSNGNLVASIATDDPAVGRRVSSELRAFKVGVNAVRSRGDRDEPFGGIGESWKGCFVGGRFLVQAVTQGPTQERLYGNFPDYTLLPDTQLH